VFEPFGVNQHQGQVNNEDQGKGWREQVTQSNRNDGQGNANGNGQTDWQLTGRQRTVALLRVLPVGFDIEQVVEQVDRT
jgi:hypothetical protein